MIVGRHRHAREEALEAAGASLADMIVALNGLVEAQADEIRTLKDLLSEWRRMARDVAVLAVDYAQGPPNPVIVERLERMAVELKDQVALQEEHMA